MTIQEINSSNSYFKKLEKNFSQIYSIASTARNKGLDPEFYPESKITNDLAERVEKSVGPSNIAERIRELSNVMPREEIAFKISEEIVEGSFNKDRIIAADQAVRTSLAILGEGVTVAPIQGIVKVTEKMNADGTRYLAIYFAGPIRSAGGTEMALTIIVTDFVRKLLGLNPYKASEEEAKRFVEELSIYEREVARFQYKFPDDIIYNSILRLPVEVTGVETDQVEVPTFKNIRRIETNRVRGGALRVLNDGLLGRANKVIKIIDKLGISGWEWLREIKAGSQDSKTSKDLMFMEDIIAGRPVFSFPSMEGGFRLRYGRSRNTGLASYGVNPQTMDVLRGFLATGTQIRTEKPGKAGIVVPVDTIEPPIIKLKDGSVIKYEEKSTINVNESIEKILFLGDLLIGFGEFIENNQILSPSGYVEEWWAEELKAKLSGLISTEIFDKITKKNLYKYIQDPFKNKPTIDEAFKLSEILGIPLHPKFTYFWKFVNLQQILLIRNKINKNIKNGEIPKELHLPFEDDTKKILEKLCIPHKIENGYIVFDQENTLIIIKSLNPFKKIESNDFKFSLDLLEYLSNIKIKDKAGTFIGARMGRPEKARPREMKPLVHVLYPVGLSGGSRRNLTEASKLQKISVEVVNRFCLKCKTEELSLVCPKCNSKTVIKYICSKCNYESLEKMDCPKCKIPLSGFTLKKLNIKNILLRACRHLGMENPPNLIKGVKGLTNDLKIPEHIEKGLLRASLGLSVFKDGSIRFDSTNAILTHFKPLEIGLSMEKSSQLGYTYDYNGKPLKNSEQICILKLQDIIVPESCGDYLLNVSKFIDELLLKFYNLSPFYNANKKEDLIGHLVVGLSPHTSVGVIGRIIGYSKTNVCFAHPLWHAAKRRDCDGDEDSVSLSLDVLLNFSRRYLPSKIGGLMDAPLLMTVRILPTEVARQAFNIETVKRFPLSFFDATLATKDSKNVAEYVEMIYNRLCTTKQFEQVLFTHNTTSINLGKHKNTYSEIPTMFDKVHQQLELADTISAVESREVAKKLVSTHFMRDLSGNLRAYSAQKVRCKKCNRKYRRIPLIGKCLNCGGGLSLTVYRGTIEKYIEVAQNIIQKYNTGEYHEQRLKLISNDINSLFKGDHIKANYKNNKYSQKGLSEFM